jgi:hypothetical protein
MLCATNECDSDSKRMMFFTKMDGYQGKKKNVSNGLDYKGGLQYLKESCCNIFATFWSLLFKYGDLRKKFIEIWLLWHFFP